MRENVHPVSAAQYLRMSTEHQQYSLENQERAITLYALRHGYKVDRSYSDAGKSGVTIRHRKALQQLLHDIVSGPVPFKAVLVYDVSRWGRFQDDDEAAHYEFLCRSAGIQVHYCTEQFTNDGTLASSLLKNLKRSMAGEYSRELSAKVFAAQRQLALRGYVPAGTPGYGLCRVAISPDGCHRYRLLPGERKPFASYHVRFAPGHPREVAVVRRIFETFLSGKGRIGAHEIARQLNGEGIRTDAGRSWSPFVVRHILSNPKYAGTLVWPKTTKKLLSKMRRVPVNQRIIQPHVYEPVVDERTFERAQTLLRQRSHKRIPDKELISSLQRIVKKHGQLTQTLLAQQGRYSLSVYRRRFGTMPRMYDLLGLDYPDAYRSNVQRGKATWLLRESLLSRLQRNFPERVSTFALSGSAKRLHLLLDGAVKIFVWAASYYRIVNGEDRWTLKVFPNETDGFVLLCLARPDYKDYDSLYLSPKISLQGSYRHFGRNDRWLKAARLIEPLNQLPTTVDDFLSLPTRNRLRAGIARSP